jgi:hypothetical protein
MRAQKARLCPLYMYVCGSLLRANTPSGCGGDLCRSATERFMGSMRICRSGFGGFIRPGATETAVSKRRFVCRDVPDRSALKTGLLISLDVQGLASERQPTGPAD